VIDLTAETFSPHLETEFVVEDPALGEPVALRLTEIRGLGRQPRAPRVEPFALLLTGPPQPLLQQRTYRLEHRVLGPLEIFLVPVGNDAVGSPTYEAVFN
jgi:hypothetical protein